MRDAELVVEAVQRPTMKFVATTTADQLDLQLPHASPEKTPMVGLIDTPPKIETIDVQGAAGAMHGVLAKAMPMWCSPCALVVNV